MDFLNRLQVASRLPEALVHSLVEVQKTIRWRAGSEAVRWTPPGELVLQLVVLGEVSVPAMAKVKVVIEPILSSTQPLNLCLEGVGGAPTSLQPRMVFANLTGDLDRLAKLHDELERAVKPVCPDHEVRPFEPHIAIGRLKQQDERDRTALGRAIKVSGIGVVGSWTLAEAELLRAEVSTTGPSLVTESSYRLGVESSHQQKPSAWTNDPLRP